jgi:hypothetical protein
MNRAGRTELRATLRAIAMWQDGATIRHAARTCGIRIATLSAALRRRGVPPQPAGRPVRVPR